MRCTLGRIAALALILVPIRTGRAFSIRSLRHVSGGSLSSIRRRRRASLSFGLLWSTASNVGLPDGAINGDYDRAIVASVSFDPTDAVSFVEQRNETIMDLDPSQVLPEASPLSYPKFLTMQDKRVIVTVRYSGDSGLKPYFLTVAKKLKASHPDVIVERRILHSNRGDNSDEETFEVLVDGKIVIGKGKPRKQKVSRVDLSRSRSVFVSMQELDLAIARARRRRRPSTTYDMRGGADKAAKGLRRESLHITHEQNNEQSHTE